jgi:peroxiredoxin
MKAACALRLISILGLALCGTAVRGATSGEQLAEGAGRSLIGTAAPRLVLKTIDGDTIDLGRLYGKQAVYLKFWATWCVPCRQQMPHFEHVYETAEPDLAVIAVNTGFNDSIDTVRTYRRQLGITMPIVIDDGQLGAVFNLRVTPQHIVIGRDGRILYVGHLADAHLDAALAAARALPAAGTGDGGMPPSSAARASSATRVRHYEVGDQLPEQAPRTLDGARFRFYDPGDPRRLILVFLSPWCESYLATTRPVVATNCRLMREQVSELAGARSEGGHARWLGIASGLWATPEDLREYRSKYAVKIPLSLDESGALFRTFQVTEVPAAIIADRNGRIVRRIGANEVDTPAALRTAIEER